MDMAVDQRGFGNRWSLTTGIAGFGLRPVINIACERQLLAKRRAGRIVTYRRKLEAVYGRWWPHAGNLLQVLWDRSFRTLRPDSCELFYREAPSSPGFLTLSYIRSGRRTSLGTIYAATLALDEIARIKRADAIVCHVTHSRISNRLLERWGWQPHCLNWAGRHFIKRFHDGYPAIATCWRSSLTLDEVVANIPGHRFSSR